jgi:hypothetical protein
MARRIGPAVSQRGIGLVRVIAYEKENLAHAQLDESGRVVSNPTTRQALGLAIQRTFIKVAQDDGFHAIGPVMVFKNLFHHPF